MNNLTPRQWWLYKQLKNYGGIPASFRRICEDCDCDLLYSGARYHYNTNPKYHDPCLSIRADVEKINASERVDKIIIIKDNQAWIANGYDDAVKNYLDIQYKKAMRALRRFATVRKKARADGQGKIISCAGAMIEDDSDAKRFISSFNEEEEDHEEF